MSISAFALTIILVAHYTRYRMKRDREEKQLIVSRYGKTIEQHKVRF